MNKVERAIREEYSMLENKQADIFLDSIENVKSENLNLLAAYMFLCLSDKQKNDVLKSIELLEKM